MRSKGGLTVSTKNFLPLPAAIALLLFLNAGSALAAGPTLSGPIAGAPTAFATTTFDLSKIGYQQAEFYARFSGSA
jgi:hypothetical protein